MTGRLRSSITVALFLLWCIAIYEPDTPEMHAVGSEVYGTIRLGMENRADVEAFLKRKEWPIRYVLTDEECRARYGASEFVCPGGDNISAIAMVDSGFCGWFRRDEVFVQFSFQSDGTVASVGTSMDPVWPIKLC